MLSRNLRTIAVLSVLSVWFLSAGCDSFGEDDAALQIRERFCRDWPYGCTDSTRVVIETVRDTHRGKQVVFRVVDRRDSTPPLSAAYFEREGDRWEFLLFEPPFNDRFEELAAEVRRDRDRLNDELRDLRRAQRWFLSIYGRYARSLAELDSVSYRPPDLPLDLRVAADGQGWSVRAATRRVRCELDVTRRTLPSCVGLAAESAGSDSGPLAQAFVTER
jgi:hypothetical protein